MRPRLVRSSLVALLPAALLFAPATLAAQAEAPPLDSAWARGTRLVRRAIDAMGGDSAVRALRDVTIESGGVKFLGGQSRTLAALDSLPYTGRTVLDLAHQRALVESEDPYLGGYRFHFRTIAEADSGVRFDVTRARTGLAAFPVSAAESRALREGAARTFPPLLLASVATHPTAYRWRGIERHGGETWHVVDAAAGTSSLPVELLLDDASGLPRGYRLASADAFGADATSEVRYADWRRVGALLVPHERTVSLAGAPVRRERWTRVALDQSPADSVFALPSAYVRQAAPPPAPLAVARLAPGLWSVTGIGGGYTSVVVEFADHLAVLEAPVSTAEGRRAIAAIRAAVPGKPIRWVALSHHHDDHLGGALAYAEIGATIIAPDGVAEYLRAAAARPRTLDPAGAVAPGTVVTVEPYARHRALADATNRVEFVEAGPLSHAERMVVFALPAQHLLFQGDLLISAEDGTVPPPIAVNAELARVLDRLPFRVDTIVGVHGRPVAATAFRAALNAER